MADYPHQWRAYARLQTELARMDRVTPRSWGVEAGLNRSLVLGLGDPAAVNEVDRARASGERRARYRAHLLRTGYDTPSRDEEPEDGLHARERLRAIEAGMSSEDWQLLTAVAIGNDYRELAAASHGSEGALRVRVLRLRRRHAADNPPRAAL